MEKKNGDLVDLYGEAAKRDDEKIMDAKAAIFWAEQFEKSPSVEDETD